MKDNIGLYTAEVEKFKFVKKRDLPKLLGGRLPVTESLAVEFLARSSDSGQSSSLDTCVSLEDAADAYGWPDDQLDLFLQQNRQAIIDNANELNFPLDSLTLDLVR